MNKFIIVLALCALVGASMAAASEIQDEQSQFAFFEDDATETSSLDKDHQMFADFCLQARDDVRAYVKQSVNEGAANAFEVISGHVGELANKVVEAERASVSKGTEMIREDARASGRAVGGVLSAIMDGVKVGFLDKVAQLRSNLSRDKLREQVLIACGSLVNSIRPLVESRLDQTKRELLGASDTTDAQKAVIEATKLANVGCIMTDRVAKFSRSCTALLAIPVESLESIGL